MKNAHPPPVDPREFCGASSFFILPRSLACLPRVASVLAFGIALSCLSAWLADYPPVGVVMNPLTTFGVMLAAAALWFSSCSPPSRMAVWLGRFFSYLLVLLALSKLAHLQLNFSPAPDRLLFFGRPYFLDMHSTTAGSFLAIGVAYASLDLSYKKVSLGQVLFILGLFPFLLVVTSYCYGVTWFYGQPPGMTVAPYLSICFVLLCLGGFFARPHTYLCQIFAAEFCILKPPPPSFRSCWQVSSVSLLRGLWFLFRAWSVPATRHAPLFWKRKRSPNPIAAPRVISSRI
jgi:hypothetical protein